jgi:hypothetical protein
VTVALTVVRRLAPNKRSPTASSLALLRRFHNSTVDKAKAEPTHRGSAAQQYYETMSRIQDKESFAWRKIGTFICATLPKKARRVFAAKTNYFLGSRVRE